MVGPRVGIVADNPNFPGEWQSVIEKVRLADALGYDSVWLGETWGYELFTSLADLMHATRTIKLGAGIANIYSRSPGVMVTSAATLDERSGGRMLLGLGSSGPQVIEHWHGVPFEKPMRRLREYVEIINMVMRREPLVYQGEIFHLERGFKLRFTPVREHIPIYLASLGPKSIEQCGAIADGILPTFWPSEQVPNLRLTLDGAATTAGRAAGSTHIAPYITTAMIVDEAQRDQARRLARNPIAWYIGRMGTFYADMLRRHGYEAEVQAVQEGWRSGADAAAAGVSDRLLDATALVGTPREVAQALQRWYALGVEEPLITLPPGSPDTVGRLLSELREALDAE